MGWSPDYVRRIYQCRLLLAFRIIGNVRQSPQAPVEVNVRYWAESRPAASGCEY
jgi:hypothetical protein